MTQSLYRSLLIVAILLAALLQCDAVMDKVNITLPTNVIFSVSNILSTTTGSPAPTSISYTNGNLHANAYLRISVMASSASCTSSNGGPTIPASSFSWAAASASGGTGYSGSISYNAYTVVYQSIPWTGSALSGSVKLTWKMAVPPNGAHAGTDTINLIWKVEAIS